MIYRDRILNPSAKKSYQGQWHELIVLNKAYAVMLENSGILLKEQRRQILDGLTRVEKSLTEDDVQGETEDLFFAMQERLYQEVGEETGSLLHTGRSRNDIFAATNRMEVRKSIWKIGDSLLRLMEKLLEEAGKNIDEPFVYYTFGQPAQPGTLGHYQMYLYEGFARDFERLKRAYENTNRSPMGAAAGTGTSFSLNRELMCELLGFDGVIAHTLDAVSAHDYVLEAQMAVSLLMGNVSRALTDLYLWSSYDAALWDFDYSICAGSSIMPQKKNPAAVEYARSRAAHTVGNLMDMTVLYQKSTSFPNIDNMELFYHYEEGIEQAVTALEELTEILCHSEPNRSMISSNMADSFIGATAFAEYLAKKFQIPFTKGHEVVGGMIRELDKAGRLSLKNMTSELMQDVSRKLFGEALVLEDEEIQNALNAKTCGTGISTSGSPSAAEVEKMIAGGQETLAADRKWLEMRQNKVKAAYQKIEDWE